MPGVELNHCRVFMFEDDLGNFSIQKTQLEIAGAVVGYERWGTSGIQKLIDFAPVDVILMDLNFPTTTGYEIFKKIREVEALKDIPVIAISASDASIEMSKVRIAGFSGYISKPIDLSKFPSQVRRVIDGEKVWFAQ